ncbi:MAG: 3-phosphoshikimate 1-carboxyvinyltransferase [Bacteroidota bacterium]
MKRKIRPSAVKGSIKAPPSKSVSQRAIAAASLAKGTSEIFYPGTGDDCLSAIAVCRSMGSTITQLPEKLGVCGGIKSTPGIINCGESGLGIRMFSAIAATIAGETTLTGQGSLSQRPMYMIESALKQLGAECRTNGGKIPVYIRGPLAGGFAKIDGSFGSQVLTGLLMAAPLAQKDVRLLVENLQSIPYIDLTINILKAFGIEVENDNYQEFYIRSDQQYKPASISVEGDWSGAAFLLVAGAIAGIVEVANLDLYSHQADKAILDALELAGAWISYKNQQIRVSQRELNCFTFDAHHCPDLFPPLVALASCCNGTSVLYGAERLKAKESDRAVTLQQEFGKMGIHISVDRNSMKITGGTPGPAVTKAHGDHRIAMAIATAALAGKGDVDIEGTECVAKSFPEFWDVLDRLCSG